MCVCVFVRAHFLIAYDICAHACICARIKGLGVCIFVSLIVMMDDCAICGSQVKLFDTAICLQSGPVVL